MKTWNNDCDCSNVRCATLNPLSDYQVCESGYCWTVGSFADMRIYAGFAKLVQMLNVHRRRVRSFMQHYDK